MSAIRTEYDVVHLHQCSWFSLFVLVVAKSLGKPVLIKIPGVGQFGIPGLAKSLLGGVKLWLLRKADVVVAMSGESLRELDEFCFRKERILRTPNGIRMSGEVYEPARGDRRGTCKVVYIGRLDAGKGLEQLLDLWPRVVRRCQVSVELEIWGEGPLGLALAERIESLGIGGSAKLCGFVDAVRERLPSMDIFVLLSEGEGNSNAILEAMAAGLPVVSTRVGGTPMLVGPEGLSLLVRPGDVTAAEEILVELAGNPGLREAVGRVMVSRIAEQFDIRKVAKTYLSAYLLLQSGRVEYMSDIGSPLVSRD